MYACIKISYDFKAYLKSECDYISDIIYGLNILRKEISFYSNMLGDALKNSGAYAGSAGALFVTAGEQIINDPSCDLGNVFQSETNIEDKRVYSVMKELGSQLGTGDAENEMLIIDSAVDKLNLLYDEYYNEFKTKEKFIIKTGVIIGMFFAIIIL